MDWFSEMKIKNQMLHLRLSIHKPEVCTLQALTPIPHCSAFGLIWFTKMSTKCIFLFLFCFSGSLDPHASKTHPLNLKIKENQLPPPFLKALLHSRVISTNITSFSPLWALQRRIIVSPKIYSVTLLQHYLNGTGGALGGRDHELLLFSCILHL